MAFRVDTLVEMYLGWSPELNSRWKFHEFSPHAACNSPLNPKLRTTVFPPTIFNRTARSADEFTKTILDPLVACFVSPVGRTAHNLALLRFVVGLTPWRLRSERA